MCVQTGVSLTGVIWVRIPYCTKRITIPLLSKHEKKITREELHVTTNKDLKYIW